MAKVCLDPGHGGHDGGAEYGNLIEKQMTLVTSLACRDELVRYGVEVLMTRTTDVYVDLTERCNIANRWGADYFVSIHYNAGGGDRGEVIHSIYRGNGLALAGKIGEEMKSLGQSTIKLYDKKGTDNKDYYAVIRQSAMDAVIVEGCFIDNETDNDIADTPAEQKAMGVAIAHGILKQLGIAIKVETQNKRYFVVTDYIPMEYDNYGVEINGVLSKFFTGIDRVYLRVNPAGCWFETQYLPYDKCVELKGKLGKLFWTIKAD